ncbi:hypothetical protein [Nonomuraea sp. NPDC050783]
MAFPSITRALCAGLLPAALTFSLTSGVAYAPLIDRITLAPYSR